MKALQFEEVINFSPGREAHLHFSKDMGHAESCLVPKADDVLLGCLTLGQLGGSVHVCMADSNWVGRLFCVLVFSGIGVLLG